MTQPIIDRIFPIDPDDLLPAITPDNQQFWEALTRGEALAQNCNGCKRTRYPIVPVCPYCCVTAWNWKTLSGKGTVFSWVRYVRSYLPEFEDLMPYVVLTVQLEEGARMFGRLIDRLDKNAPVNIGAPVEMVIERWPGDRHVPAFRFATKGK